MLGLNGGLMGVRKVPTVGGASGMWVSNEQSLAKRADIWPIIIPAFRYYRFNGFASTVLTANTIDFGEIELYDGNTKHTGITCTSSFFSNADSAVLVDGNLGETPRVFYSGWSSIQPTATITFDLGTAKAVSHVQIYSVYSQPRFPSAFDLQSSDDNSSWTTVKRVTVGAEFTLVSGVTYTSGKVSVY